MDVLKLLLSACIIVIISSSLLGSSAKHLTLSYLQCLACNNTGGAVGQTSTQTLLPVSNITKYNP